MSIKDQLTQDMKAAMKAHDQARLSVIRMARGAIRQAEIDGGKRDEGLSDEESIAILSHEVKQRRESIEEFRKGGREDLVQQTQAEIEVLMKYLPAQLSEDEVKKLVAEAIAETGAASPKDMGKVMKALMPKTKGRADGKLVSSLVKAALAG